MLLEQNAEGACNSYLQFEAFGCSTMIEGQAVGGDQPKDRLNGRNHDELHRFAGDHRTTTQLQIKARRTEDVPAHILRLEMAAAPDGQPIVKYMNKAVSRP